MSQYETTTFEDTSQGTVVGFPPAEDPTRDGVFAASDVSLAEFFSRPIVISTATWTPGSVTPFSMAFDPWNLFFTNKRVINRINNFAQMRASLHVRFVINGNGFYYGRLMADYNPLSDLDLTSDTATLPAINRVQASQRMKVFLDPSCPCTQQMDLPFVWFEDTVSVVDAKWRDLGVIRVRELVGLKHANAGTTPIEVSVYAWATDVKLACPTVVNSVELVEQAGEEYAEKGPVENVATATASIAGKLSALPLIGPYARATSMAANSVSKVASLMGWSRPPIIDPPTIMRPQLVSAFAPADAGDCVQKLTVDSKQELTVDPRVMGVDLPDELQIANLASRESYLTSFTWAVSDDVDALLYSSRVTPMLTVKDGSSYGLPACAFVANPFNYWRGKMRVRMQIVASAFHRGRFRIVYDPVATPSAEYNVQYNTVVDIADEKDITFSLGWAQARHFLPCSTIADGALYYSDLSAFGTANAECNGVFSVYVVNTLAVPSSLVNNDIKVNVFVSFEDFEVADPRKIDVVTVSSALAPDLFREQAGEDMSEENAEANDPGCGESTVTHQIGETSESPHSMEVYFGERIVSLRQLLRRYTLSYSTTFTPPATTASTYYAEVVPNFPYSLGYDAAGPHTTGTIPFAFVQNILLNYLKPAFVGVKGSVRSKYFIAPTNLVSKLSVDRISDGTRGTTVLELLPTTSPTTYAFENLVNRQSLLSGGAMTCPVMQPFLEVEHPFQRDLRFANSRTAGSIEETYSPYNDCHRLEVVTGTTVSPMLIDRFVSVGEDFSFTWFQGAPPVQYLGIPFP